jgi:hypothetical protein
MALNQRPYGPSAGNPAGLSTFAQNAAAVGAVPGPLPALQLVTSATEVVIINPLTAALATPLALNVALPPKVGLEQIPFDLNVSGYITTTASGNQTLKLYSGTSTTVASDKLLGSSGAIAQNTASAPFYIAAKLIYDSVSGLLCGKIEFYVNKTIVTAVTLSNFVASVSDANDPVLSFLLSLTSSGALTTAITTINVQNFSAG